ncbi:MAG TPA: metallophosphoesterase [Candidatus Cybelea sp.]|nr:metallophosphoesterase [Candidatus Cybelea sp.]
MTVGARLFPLANFLAALLAFGWCSLPADAASEQIWLALSDVHLNAFDRSPRPSRRGLDTNIALLQSAVAQMKRTVHDPAVVLVSGDFLMHGLLEHAGSRSAADDDGLASMRLIATLLGRSFPKSHFAIALGNNDTPCGDYRSAAGSKYLADVAAIWKPLVDRDGASPGFVSSFARGGYYTATLPLPRLRLVALDTVPFSAEYSGSCGESPSPATAELTWFANALRDTPLGTRNIVLLHIPPGIDAFATDYAYDLIAWPLLKPRYANALLDAMQSRPANVLFAIAGHTHRFDFRLAGKVPIVGLGALSPIYANNPTYYALRLARDGSLRDIDLYRFDEDRQRWLPPHRFDRMWGLQRIDARSLARLHARIAASSAVRSEWNLQASGWSSSVYGPAEPWGKAWRVAWCAQDAVASGFAACAGTDRRVGTLIAVVSLGSSAAVLLVLFLVRRHRRRT